MAVVLRHLGRERGVERGLDAEEPGDDLGHGGGVVVEDCADVRRLAVRKLGGKRDAGGLERPDGGRVVGVDVEELAADLLGAAADRGGVLRKILALHADEGQEAVADDVLGDAAVRRAERLLHRHPVVAAERRRRDGMRDDLAEADAGVLGEGREIRDEERTAAGDRVPVRALLEETGHDAVDGVRVETHEEPAVERVVLGLGLPELVHLRVQEIVEEADGVRGFRGKRVGRGVRPARSLAGELEESLEVPRRLGRTAFGESEEVRDGLRVVLGERLVAEVVRRGVLLVLVVAEERPLASVPARLVPREPLTETLVVSETVCGADVLELPRGERGEEPEAGLGDLDLADGAAERHRGAYAHVDGEPRLSAGERAEVLGLVHAVLHGDLADLVLDDLTEHLGKGGDVVVHRDGERVGRGRSVLRLHGDAAEGRRLPGEPAVCGREVRRTGADLLANLLVVGGELVDLREADGKTVGELVGLAGIADVLLDPLEVEDLPGNLDALALLGLEPVAELGRLAELGDAGDLLGVRRGGLVHQLERALERRPLVPRRPGVGLEGAAGDVGEHLRHGLRDRRLHPVRLVDELGDDGVELTDRGEVLEVDRRVVGEVGRSRLLAEVVRLLLGDGGSLRHRVHVGDAALDERGVAHAARKGLAYRLLERVGVASRVGDELLETALVGDDLLRAYRMARRLVDEPVAAETEVDEIAEVEEHGCAADVLRDDREGAEVRVVLPLFGAVAAERGGELHERLGAEPRALAERDRAVREDDLLVDAGGERGACAVDVAHEVGVVVLGRLLLGELERGVHRADEVGDRAVEMVAEDALARGLGERAQEDGVQDAARHVLVHERIDRDEHVGALVRVLVGVHAERVEDGRVLCEVSRLRGDRVLRDAVALEQTLSETHVAVLAPRAFPRGAGRGGLDVRRLHALGGAVPLGGEREVLREEFLGTLLLDVVSVLLAEHRMELALVRDVPEHREVFLGEVEVADEMEHVVGLDHLRLREEDAGGRLRVPAVAHHRVKLGESGGAERLLLPLAVRRVADVDCVGAVLLLHGDEREVPVRVDAALVLVVGGGLGEDDAAVPGVDEVRDLRHAEDLLVALAETPLGSVEAEAEGVRRRLERPAVLDRVDRVVLRDVGHDVRGHAGDGIAVERLGERNLPVDPLRVDETLGADEVEGRIVDGRVEEVGVRLEPDRVHQTDVGVVGLREMTGEEVGRGERDLLVGLVDGLHVPVVELGRGVERTVHEPAVLGELPEHHLAGLVDRVLVPVLLGDVGKGLVLDLPVRERAELVDGEVGRHDLAGLRGERLLRLRVDVFGRHLIGGHAPGVGLRDRSVDRGETALEFGDLLALGGGRVLRLPVGHEPVVGEVEQLGDADAVLAEPCGVHPGETELIGLADKLLAEPFLEGAADVGRQSHVPCDPLFGVCRGERHVARHGSAGETDDLVRRAAVPRRLLAFERGLGLVEDLRELRRVVEHGVLADEGLRRLFGVEIGRAGVLFVVRELAVREKRDGHDLLGVLPRRLREGRDELPVTLDAAVADLLETLGLVADVLGRLLVASRVRGVELLVELLDACVVAGGEVLVELEIRAVLHRHRAVVAERVGDPLEPGADVAETSAASDRGLEAHDGRTAHERHRESHGFRRELVPPRVEALHGLLEVGEEIVFGPVVETEHPLDDVRIAFLEHFAEDAVVAHLLVEVHHRLGSDVVLGHPVGDGEAGVRLVLEVLRPLVVRLAHGPVDERRDVPADPVGDVTAESGRVPGTDRGIESRTVGVRRDAERLRRGLELVLLRLADELLAGAERPRHHLADLPAERTGGLRIRRDDSAELVDGEGRLRDESLDTGLLESETSRTEKRLETASRVLGDVLEHVHAERDRLGVGHELLVVAHVRRRLKRKLGRADSLVDSREGLDERLGEKLVGGRQGGALDGGLHEKRADRVGERTTRGRTLREEDGGLLRPPLSEVHESAGDVLAEPLGEAVVVVAHHAVRVAGEHLGELVLGAVLRHAAESGLRHPAVDGVVAHRGVQHLGRDALDDLVLRPVLDEVGERLGAKLADGLLHGVLREVFGRLAGERLRRTGHPEMDPGPDGLRGRGAAGGEETAGREELDHEPGSGADDVAHRRAPRPVLAVLLLFKIEARLDNLLVGDVVPVLELLERAGHHRGVLDGSADRGEERDERKVRPGEIGDGLEETALQALAVPLGERQEFAAGLRRAEVLGGHLLAEHGKLGDGVGTEVRLESDAASVRLGLLSERVGVELEHVPRVPDALHGGVDRVGVVDAPVVRLYGSEGIGEIVRRRRTRHVCRIEGIGVGGEGRVRGQTEGAGATRESVVHHLQSP